MLLRNIIQQSWIEAWPKYPQKYRADHCEYIRYIGWSLVYGSVIFLTFRSQYKRYSQTKICTKRMNRNWPTRIWNLCNRKLFQCKNSAGKKEPEIPMKIIENVNRRRADTCRSIKTICTVHAVVWPNKADFRKLIKPLNGVYVCAIPVAIFNCIHWNAKFSIWQWKKWPH